MATIAEYVTGYDFDCEILASNTCAQTFTVGSVAFTLHAVQIYVMDGLGNQCIAYIHNVGTDGAPSGNYISQAIFDTGSSSTMVFDQIGGFTPVTLQSGTQYALSIISPFADSTFYPLWGVDNTSATYTGGMLWSSTDAGLTWPVSGPGTDALFRILGSEIFPANTGGIGALPLINRQVIL